ncbi:hypothetical protein PMIN04_013085, partial [Paraphaeosphaeria minitans]
MFTVSSGDALSSSLWLVSVIGCCCAATILVIRLWCEKTNKTQHAVTALGYVIAFSLSCSLIFVPNTNSDWDIHGVIATSSLLSASLTEAYYFLYLAKLLVLHLEPQLQGFWTVSIIILALAPSLSSYILFSPIDLSTSKRLSLVYSVPIFVFLRSCLTGWAHVYIAVATCPNLDSLEYKSRSAVLLYSTLLPAAKSDVEKQQSNRQQQHPICRNAARVSMIECVALLGVSISAKWCFDP